MASWHTSLDSTKTLPKILLLDIYINEVIPRYAPLLSEAKKMPPSAVGLLTVTFRLLFELDLLLMIPITIFIGVGEAFITSDFTSVRKIFGSAV